MGISLKEEREKQEIIDIIKHLQKSEEDIENGRTTPANEFFRELRKECGF